MPSRYWTTRRIGTGAALVAAGVALLVFAELAEDLLEGELRPMDTAVIDAIQPYRHVHALYVASVIFSRMLAWPLVVVLVAPFLIYLLATKHYTFAGVVSGFVLLSVLFVGATKDIFGRPRPAAPLIKVVGFSFPSGHAAIGLVLYGLLGYIVWRHLPGKPWARAVVVIVTAFLIVATGFSRVFLGVHYPSDVFAGWAAGIFILIGSILLLESHPEW